jgi:hypothetical protein
VLSRVRREPYGPVAARIAELLNERDYEESGALWRSFLDQARERDIAKSRRGIALPKATMRESERRVMTARRTSNTARPAGRSATS